MVATSIGVDEVWEWWLVRWKNCLFVDYCNEIHDVDIEFCNNHNCDDDVNIECLLGLKSSVWERLSIDLMPLNRWFELMILIDVKWFVENFLIIFVFENLQFQYRFNSMRDIMNSMMFFFLSNWSKGDCCSHFPQSLLG